MLSTMQDEPLSLATLLRYATTVHGTARVTTWTPDGVDQMTFAELGHDAARLAHALRALGIEEGDRVGSYLWNNRAHMTAYCAVPAMGAVLHTLNIRLAPQQNVYIANHAGDKAVIVDGSLSAQFADVLPHLTSVRHVIVTSSGPVEFDAPAGVVIHRYEDLLAAQPDEYDWPELDERAAAASCYTSGTTGDAKGVMYSHRSIWLHSLQVCATYGMALSPHDSALTIVPMFHAMAWGIPYAALMAGASLVLPDRYLHAPDLVRLLAQERPTFAAAVPTIWIGVLDQLDRHPQDVTHLRNVVVGGSAVPPALMDAFAERHGVDIIQAWGMTETSPLGSLAWAPPTAEGDDAWRYRYTQGRLLPGVQARLVNDRGEVQPWDGRSLGELEVRGPWVTGRYFAPEGTDAADPEKFGDGWLRTGDIGSITQDGYLSLTDRSKDVIKSGGEWISSVQLENAVMAHPAVSEAAVIGVPDQVWDERPLVAVVLSDGAQVTPRDLRAHLTSSFAKWQLPEHWTFIDEVPKTSVGKFDKKQLRAAFHDGTLEVTTLT
ncbi:long-chain fatty acid--CoA ligase [Nocardia pneumoniae]|uniref:long-chain fatty acid--CoA ligase n=2 Tax=Nocardia TaxID=1817 RepID=UPI0002F1E702|nr:long-chain fatty acid--CoA ligase [Nocardia pneumoniae]